jgi:septal ring factor EnvC (AmiA/AmiB activator)
MKVLNAIAVIFLCLILPPVFAGTPAVNDLKEQVKQSRVALELTRKKFHESVEALQELETKLALGARALSKTDASIDQNRRAIENKKTSLTANKEQLTNRMGELEKSLQGINQWLNESSLKWILSSDDPGDWDRLATYHRIIGHSQQQLITELKDLQQRILEDQVALEKLAVSLEKERAKRQQSLAQLRALKLDREELVATLQASVKQKTRQLSRDEKQLQSVLSGFIRSNPVFSGHFDKLKGKLNWPVQGHMERLFNRSIEGSELTWRAILFSAPEGSIVQAVAPGRVVYAGWMSGYGWLMIIEHDDGYMTLYGRNHYLYKDVGQEVGMGETIARSGKSGGFSEPALYFALWHNAKPLDPSLWLVSK